MGLTNNLGKLSNMITSTGSAVGIGTTTIGSTLQVNGGTAIGYSASTAAPTNGLAVSGAVTIGNSASATNGLSVTGTYGSNPAIIISGSTYSLLSVNRGTAATSAGVLYSSLGTNKWFAGIYENSDNFAFYSYSLSANALVINNATGAATFSSTITSQANGSTFGTASAGGRSIILQADSGNGAITFRNAAGGDGNLLVTGTSTSLNYRFDTYSVGNALAISNAGNVGIGLVASAWDSGTENALQVKAASIYSYGNYELGLQENAYYSSNSWKYIYSTWATQIQLSSGEFLFRNGPSGTAGNAISWTTRMSLTSGGTLTFNNNPTSNYEIDSATRISIAVGGTFPFANFSGMVIVNNMSNGAVGIWLVGAGTTSLVSTVGGSAGLGTFAYTSGNVGYTWTSNYSITANYGFFAVRTRPEA